MELIGLVLHHDDFHLFENLEAKGSLYYKWSSMPVQNIVEMHLHHDFLPSFFGGESDLIEVLVFWLPVLGSSDFLPNLNTYILIATSTTYYQRRTRVHFSSFRRLRDTVTSITLTRHLEYL